MLSRTDTETRPHVHMVIIKGWQESNTSRLIPWESVLSVFLEVYAQREVTQRLNSDFGKFQWDNSMSDNYHNNFLQQDSVNDILSLLEVIDTENSDINHVLSKVNDIYIKAASKTTI